MNLGDLTHQQRHRLESMAGRHRNFYHDLCQRMQATGWSPDDPIYLSVVRAHDAAQEVVVRLYHGGDLTGPSPFGPEEPT